MRTDFHRIPREEATRLITSYHIRMSGIEESTLRRCLGASTIIWEGKADDKLVCVWGLIPPCLLADSAYLWLFTTEHLREYQFLFIRRSQLAIEAALAEYPLITGVCDLRNTKAIRWLRWLGARFWEPRDMLVPFEIRRKDG